MNLKFIFPILVLILFISGCQEPVPLADDTGATDESVQSVVDANNQFALELYSELGKEENIFFSPYSISTALAMTYEGARGQTADEMREVFHFTKDDIRKPSFARIYNEINKKDKGYKLNTANALWVQQDYQLLNKYTSTIENYYGGKATNVDFKTAPEETRQIINSWVEEQTNNKIKDLISSGMLNSMTRLVLTNAIYFKGTWVRQFDKKDTREEDFKITPDNVVKVPMMKLTDDEAMFNYGENDYLQILEMPYEGEDLSMLLILPKENLDSIELTEENLAEWKGTMMKQPVYIYMPKFTFKTKYLMNENLKEMGMPTAFSSNADFSGITGKQDLFISFVIHQSFVDVNEEGTEAAAATGVGMEITAIRVENIFRADHPFIFIIQQKDTGNILFLGKVLDPTK